MRTDSAITAHSPSATRVECYDTIVVGGGQAGLAAGYHLAQKDIDFLIVDGNERVGDSWRNRWDSLRLFTPAKYSGLPGMPFPAAPLHLPDKDEVADCLERYVERFDLPVQSSTRVTSLTRDGQRYLLSAGRVAYRANNVIVATGPFQRPRVPAIASQLPRSVHQLHSSEYRNPFDLPAGSVLVVGAGNSGAQIAMELAQTRQVWLAGRESGHLRRAALEETVASHPDQLARLEKATGMPMTPPTGVLAFGSAVASTGLVRLMTREVAPARAPRFVRKASAAYAATSVRALLRETTVRAVRSAGDTARISGTAR